MARPEAIAVVMVQLLLRSNVLQFRMYVPPGEVANQASLDLLHHPKERVVNQDLLHLLRERVASQAPHHLPRVRVESQDQHHLPRVNLESLDQHHHLRVRPERLVVRFFV